MSGAFPTSPNFRALNFKDNRPTLVNQTLSGRKQVRQIGSQYFSFTVQMPPMTQTDSQAIFAFLQKQKGSFENFTIAHPLDNLGASKNETDILVNGSHTTSDASIALDGFTANTTGALKAGDLIKFNGHNKVYMVTGDANSSAGGAATISIEPPLQAALANNEDIDTNQPSFTVALVQDDLLYATDASGFFSLSFDVREVL